LGGCVKQKEIIKNFGKKKKTKNKNRTTADQSKKAAKGKRGEKSPHPCKSLRGKKEPQKWGGTNQKRNEAIGESSPSQG